MEGRETSGNYLKPPSTSPPSTSYSRTISPFEEDQSTPDFSMLNEEVEIEALEDDHHYAVSSHSSLSSARLNTPARPLKKRVAAPIPSAAEQLLQLDQEKLQEIRKWRKNNEEEELQRDEHYHFVMSLLPKLWSIPSSRTFSVRMEIMKILDKE